MALYTHWDAIFNATTAGVMALFGVWVLTLKPRSRRSLFLGWFAVIHGASYVLFNLWDVSSSSPDGFRFVNTINLVSAAASTAALSGVAYEILRDHGVSGRTAWRTAWPTVLATAVAVWYLAGLSLGIPPVLQINYVMLAAAACAFSVFVVAFGALPLVFAWLYRTAEARQVEKRRGLLTMSVALVFWPAMIGVYGLRQYLFSGPFFQYHYLAAGLFVLAAGILWLFNIAVDARLSRAARNAAWVVFAALAFGAFDAVVLAKAFDYSFNSGGPFFGLARLATVVILAHAILNQQVLGMDVKLRFALSKSTIAAVFIAVFFIVSETAQPFFGTQFNSAYVGIAGAGALVFAMAPLQRAAERLAEKAVPVTAAAAPGRTPGPAADGDGQEAIYRKALRVALRDRVLTRAEEGHLYDLAEALRIPPRRAHEMLAEVERELGGGMS
jgi:hypothetical protein